MFEHVQTFPLGHPDHPGGAVVEKKGSTETAATTKTYTLDEWAAALKSQR